MATVAELWRYPVKSMQGTPVESLTVGADGVEGDRRWGVVDPAAGQVLSAKRWPPLLLASAALGDDGTVTITLPDGSTHRAGDPTTDAAVSAWLDHDVRVMPPPADTAMPYELYVDATDDTSDTWEFPGPPGGPFVDVAAVHVLTTASLGSYDVRRFRPNVLVEGEGDGYIEDGWVGSTVALGDDVVVAPFMRTPRCSMTTRAQPGLDRDVGVAKALNAAHALDLGVYCGVETGGVVRIGDRVSVGT